jgi:hypothetical protein
LYAVLVAEAVALAAVTVVAADMRAHYHVQDLGGVNVWGYRGPVLNQKRPDEIRLALVGGDLAFGWGVAANETLPYFVRRLVALDVMHVEPPVTVTAVNLSARGLDPAEFRSWLARFGYLRPDVVCLLPDVTSHPPHSDRFLPDRQSLFFNAFGYSPILPLVVREKGLLAGSAALQTAGAALERLDPTAGSPRVERYTDRSAAIAAAIDEALRLAAIGVVLVLPPDDQALAMSASDGGRLRVVNLAGVPSMRDPALRLDGYYFSVAGHSRAADAVAPAVVDLIRVSGRLRR